MNIIFKISLTCDCCGANIEDREFDLLSVLKEDADDEIKDLNETNHTNVETLDCVYGHLCRDCYSEFKKEGELV